MLKEPQHKQLWVSTQGVLILILMEHAQRGGGVSNGERILIVLILILMEHAQRDQNLHLV